MTINIDATKPTNINTPRRNGALNQTRFKEEQALKNKKKITERAVNTNRNLPNYEKINAPIKQIYKKYYANEPYNLKLQNSLTLIQNEITLLNNKKTTQNSLLEKKKKFRDATKTFSEAKIKLDKASIKRARLISAIFITLPFVFIPMILCFALLRSDEKYQKLEKIYKEEETKYNALNKSTSSLSTQIKKNEKNYNQLTTKEEMLYEELNKLNDKIETFNKKDLGIELFDAITHYLDKNYIAEQRGSLKSIIGDCKRNMRLGGKSTLEKTEELINQIPIIDQWINQLPIERYISKNNEAHLYLDHLKMAPIQEKFLKYFLNQGEKFNITLDELNNIIKKPAPKKNNEAINSDAFKRNLKKAFIEALQSSLFIPPKNNSHNTQNHFKIILQKMLGTELNEMDYENLLKSYSQIPTYIPYHIITGLLPSQGLDVSKSASHNIFFDQSSQKIKLSSKIEPICLKKSTKILSPSIVLTEKKIETIYILTPQGFQLESIELPEEKKILDLIFAPSQFEKNALMKKYVQESANAS